MTTPPATDHLAVLLAHAPIATDSRQLRVRWLLDMAAELDTTSIDGAPDVASTARDLALALVTATVNHVGGGKAA